VFTNGQSKNISDHQWVIEFPAHFNSSAVFFDLRPEDKTRVVKYLHLSPDGKEIPITIYQDSQHWNDLPDFQIVIDKKLKHYENIFGPFPHPSITILITILLDLEWNTQGSGY